MAKVALFLPGRKIIQQEVSMTARGIGDIRGIRSVHTRPGPLTESRGFLKLYQLATEKEHVMKKLAWASRQSRQAETRLSEIQREIQLIEGRAKRQQPAEEQTTTVPTTEQHHEFQGTFFAY
jgi:hypothetical protein